MSEDRLWLLGAADPEMVMIEQLLRDAGERVALAVAGGSRVHPGNAYAADRPGVAHAAAPGKSLHVILVECGVRPGAPAGANRDVTVTVVDHHRPGDPGYGRDPDAFLPASSLGQVLQRLARAGVLRGEALLPGEAVSGPVRLADGTPPECQGRPGTFYWRPETGWLLALTETPGPAGFQALRLEREWVLAAAADHCLEAAYRGRCPGVDPDELMRWRVETRAAFQGRPAAAVLADVEAARRLLQNTVFCQFQETDPHGPTWWRVGGDATPPVADMRYRGHVPELPEAAAREGIPFVAETTDRDGRRKIVLQAAPPDLVRRFLAGEIVPGLAGEKYGDEQRGMAGWYVAARGVPS